MDLVPLNSQNTSLDYIPILMIVTKLAYLFFSCVLEARCMGDC